MSFKPALRCIALAVIGCTLVGGFISRARGQIAWTGNDDGSSHVIHASGGDYTVQYPNTNYWTAEQVLDGEGHIIAPGNWSIPNYPNSSGVGVSIGPAIPGKSYPPFIKDVAVSCGNLGLSSGAELDLQGAGGALTVYGDIDNAGQIQLFDSGSVPYGLTNLRLGPGDVVLSGGGTITMRGAVANLVDSSNFWPRTTIEGTAVDSRLINVNNTLQGSGSIGGFRGLRSIGLENGGLIDANVPGANLALQPSVTGVINTGTMRATSGGALNLAEGTYNNASGLIQAQAGSTVWLSKASISGGAIDVQSGGTLRVGDPTYNGRNSTSQFTGTLTTHAGGFVQLDFPLQLGAGSALVNDGTIKSGGLSVLSGDLTYSGTGTFNASISGPSGSHFFNQTILHGSGAISGLSVTNVGQTVQASSGESFSITGSILNNSGGTIQALAGGTITIGGNATITGGVLQTAPGGTLWILGATLPDPGSVQLQNQGTFSTGSYSGALSVGAGDFRMTGGGTLASGSFVGLSPSSRVINVDNTIRGNVVLSGTIEFVNQMPINADFPAEPDEGISITSSGGAASFTNTSTMQASNGGALLLGGAINNSGGVVEAKSGSIVTLLASEFTGGTLRTEAGGTIIVRGEVTYDTGIPIGPPCHVSGLATLSNAAGGQFVVGSNSNVELNPTTIVSNAGEILVDSGKITIAGGDVTLPSGGTVTLQNSYSNYLARIDGTGAAPRLINAAGSTIHGSGFIGNTALAIINQSLISADAPDPYHDLYLSSNSAGLENSGTIRAMNGRSLALIGGPVNNTGIIAAFDVGAIDAQGVPINNSGTMEAHDTAFFYVESSGYNTVLNSGLIEARDQSYIQLQPATTVNTGTIRATDSASLTFWGATFDNTGGRIEAIGDGAIIYINGFNGVPSFNNTGTVSILKGPTTNNQLLAYKEFSQTAGSTLIDGQLTAPELDLHGGTLSGSGLIVANLVQDGGAISPGSSPGALHVTGNYTISTAGQLHLELGGLTPGTGYDQLLVTGAATLGGTLDVALINGFAPGLGNQFTVLTFGSRSGDFASYSGLSVGGHLALRHSFTATSLLLTARPAIDGDINLDGTVDIFDINSVSSKWSTTGPQGDANGDGIVDIFDVNMISANWGATGGGATAVPEPSTFIGISIGLLCVVAIGWRRRR